MVVFDLLAIAFASMVLWHWIVFGVLLLFLIGALHEEELGASTIATGLMIGGMYLVSESNEQLEFSVWSFLAFLAVYVGLGVAWAFFKWTKLIIFRAKNNYDQPRVERHKAVLTLWIAYWPLSIVGYIIVDLLHDFWEGVLSSIKSTFNGWSDKLYAKHKKGDDA